MKNYDNDDGYYCSCMSAEEVADNINAGNLFCSRCKRHVDFFLREPPSAFADWDCAIIEYRMPLGWEYREPELYEKWQKLFIEEYGDE